MQKPSPFCYQLFKKTPFFDDHTYTLYAPLSDKPSAESMWAFWHELAHAWLHEANSRFNFDLFYPTSTKMQFALMAFDEGFAEFCSQELLELTDYGRTVPLEKMQLDDPRYWSEERSKFSMYISDFQREHQELISRIRSQQESVDGRTKGKIGRSERYDIFKRFQAYVETINEMIHRNGYYFVAKNAESLRKKGADLPTTVEYVLGCEPKTYDDLIGDVLYHLPTARTINRTQ